MNLLEILKQLKNIEPDKDFSAKSLNFILRRTTAPMERNRYALNAANVWYFVRNNVEFGASLAMMVFVMYIMLGGFASWKWSAPLQVANLDPAALKAEAQAVDLQIRLTNLNYEAGDLEKSLRLSESTPSSTLAGGLPNDLKLGGTASGTLSVDEALNRLSQ